MPFMPQNSQPSSGFSSAAGQQSPSRDYGSAEHSRLRRHIQSQWKKRNSESIE